METFEQEIRRLLAEYHLNARKRLGQNFLVDSAVVSRIIQATDLSGDDTVLEIGSGPGILTGLIAEKAGKVFAIELDRGFIKILEDRFGGNSKVGIVRGDILKIDLLPLFSAEREKPVKIIANLPYYITTPILMRLLSLKLPPLSTMFVMVQKEVGMRLAAKPCSKDYGILTLVTRYYAEPEMLLLVPRNSFMPSPAVDSALLKLTVLERPPVNVKDEKLFFSVIKTAFGHRRKMLVNSFVKSPLGSSTKKQVLSFFSAAGIDPRRRAEELGMGDFARLSDVIHDNKQMLDPGS